MSEPDRSTDKPTGLRRRRARRIAPLAAHWVPEDVELWTEPAEDADAVVAVAPNGPPEALYGSESGETPSGRIRTAGDDQGEHSEPYNAWPGQGWPAVPVHTVVEERQHERPNRPSWRSADDAALTALLDWVPPEVDSPRPPPFGAVVLPAVVPGQPRPAAHLAFMAEVARACRQSAHVVIDTGGDAAESLADDVRALLAVAASASAVVALAHAG